MSFYHSKEGVSQYIEMAEGYDGRALVAVLAEHLETGASVLEIGIGPGVDMDLLSKHFAVTGSDYSQLFLDRYRNSHPAADLIHLDAISLEVDRHFDAIYSNKVLHHLEDNDLRKSLQRQHGVLNPHGIILHSFWYGDRLEEHGGMKFHYHSESFLHDVFSPCFEIIQLKCYAEMEENDSAYVLAMRYEDTQSVGASCSPRSLGVAYVTPLPKALAPKGIVALHFRKMMIDDLPAVFSVRTSTLENAITMEELKEDYGITIESLAVAMHTHVDGWLCEDTGVVVGFSMGDRLNGEVQVVAVHPNYKGRGIGKALLNRVKDWLFSSGHEEIWLGAYPDPNIRAYGFYRKLGWQATGKMKGYDEIMVLRDVEC